MIRHQQHNTGGMYNYNIRFYHGDVWYAHFHQNIELIYNIKGKITVTIDDRQHHLAENDFAMVLPNEIHSITVDEIGEYFIIVFSGDFVAKFRTYIQEKQAVHPVFRCDETVLALFRRYILTDEGDLLMKKAALYAVCSEFLQKSELLPRSVAGQNVAGRVLDYIATNYHRDISLRTCSEELGYEYHYLSRLLQKSYGINFRRTLNEYRLGEAVDLIAGGEHTMAEIAMQCGFQSIRSFNDAFQKHLGKTPRSFLNKENPDAETVS